MAQNNKIQTTELDFDGIKQNLREFLQGQQKFSDYNFEGSGLSVLLDVLAYNTHYNALYDNLAINEAFLDSASKRSSVVSKAKELGYIPRSARAATATVKVVMLNSQTAAPNQIEIPGNAKFTTVVNGNTYTFRTQQSYIATKQSNQYVFNNVEIKEGEYIVNTFVADGVNNKFTIPNTGLDTSTLKVLVQDNSTSSTYNVYSYSGSLLNIDGTSKVYFLRELADNSYEIEFGNDAIGKALVAGNVITISYLIPKQDLVNGARIFTFAETVDNDTTSYVVTLSPAANGSAPENIDSIKWNAPRTYTAQNRCVTLEDYRAVIQSLYPDARSINVWGGEENNPPQYGDVYIAIKPGSSDTLSDSEKSYILNDILKPRTMVTMHPKLVDPTYIYVEMATSFYYNPELTQRSAGDLSSLVRQAVLQYDADNLSKFGGILKYSALSRKIDGAEPSIVNSITTLKLHRVIDPVYNQTVQYTVDIGNPIYYSGVAEDSVLSTGIRILGQSKTVYLTDVPAASGNTGTLRMFYYIGSRREYIKKDVGTVNYATGLITINNITITGLTDPEFKVIIKPQSNDVASAHNQIVTIPSTLLSVTAVIDNNADNYSFTSSRN